MNVTTNESFVQLMTDTLDRLILANNYAPTINMMIMMSKSMPMQ